MRDAGDMSLDFEGVKKFGPVGQCMYCHTTEGPFSSEHIVPLSLSGTLELLGSSCARCATETSKFERHMAQIVWGNIRAKYGFPTRRKARRPTHVDAPGPEGQAVAIPVADYPAAAIMLYPRSPNALTGLVTDEAEFTVRIFQTEGADPRDYGLERFEVPFTFDPFKYFRMIAKIAHGMAVLRYGIDGFDPVLNDIIVNPGATDMHSLFRFVGGYPDIDPPKHKRTGITHTFATVWKDDPSGEVWICEEFQLFSNWGQPTEGGGLIGTPRYLVVVGKPNALTTERPESALFYPAA